MTSTPVVDQHTTLVALLSVAHTPEQAEHAAKTVLEAHARYLAEKIRAEKGSGTYEPGVIFRGGMDFAADLIDPEAQP
ncbi:MAG: hypothetical protein HOZ81_20300 [Streptomyces sp.]|nr:hypothetical protein [Streptomyces sp.]NUS81883.1 hypothetical protein [Streptomyces sp.]